MSVDRHAARAIDAIVQDDKNAGFHHGNSSRKAFRRPHVSLANLGARGSAIRYRALNCITSFTEFTGCWRDAIETKYLRVCYAMMLLNKSILCLKSQGPYLMTLLPPGPAINVEIDQISNCCISFNGLIGYLI